MVNESRKNLVVGDVDKLASKIVTSLSQDGDVILNLLFQDSCVIENLVYLPSCQVMNSLFSCWLISLAAKYDIWGKGPT